MVSFCIRLFCQMNLSLSATKCKQFAIKKNSRKTGSIQTHSTLLAAAFFEFLAASAHTRIIATDLGRLIHDRCDFVMMVVVIAVGSMHMNGFVQFIKFKCGFCVVFLIDHHGMVSDIHHYFEMVSSAGSVLGRSMRPSMDSRVWISR
jgi:hypothetical protein